MPSRSLTDSKQDQSTSNHPYDRFHEEFRFTLAHDEETRRRIFHLRHDVYCAELGYEQPTDPLRQLEYDAYDEHSLLCLIEHKKSGLAAGCMRLVLPESLRDGHAKTLPLQEYGGNSLTHDTLHPSHFCPDTICEISRLAISPLFRRRKTQDEIARLTRSRHMFTDAERETFPLIVIGLFLATYALLGLSGRPHAFAMMEPRLPRLLKMSGFYFTGIGESIDFHGRRSAFYIDQRQVEMDMHQKLMPFYFFIKQELASQMAGSTCKQAVLPLF